MKVRSSLKSLKTRHRDCKVVRRKGVVFVINKTDPRFKAKQGYAAFAARRFCGVRTLGRAQAARRATARLKDDDPQAADFGPRPFSCSRLSRACPQG